MWAGQTLMPVGKKIAESAAESKLGGHYMVCQMVAVETVCD